MCKSQGFFCKPHELFSHSTDFFSLVSQLFSYWIVEFHQIAWRFGEMFLILHL